MALNYYSFTTEQSDRYDDLIIELVAWLSHQSQGCDTIVAEGTAKRRPALIDPTVYMLFVYWDFNPFQLR